jgi:hypothetical protein
VDPRAALDDVEKRTFLTLSGLELRPLGHPACIPTELSRSENRVLRRIFGPKRDEVTGEWKKLHNEELHNLYSSLNIIRMIKTRRMRWAGHVARMRRR